MADNEKLFWFMGKPAKITSTLFLAVFATTVGSSLLFGYSMAVFNNLEKRVKCFLMAEACSVFIDQEHQLQANAWYAGLTTAYIVLGTVGSFCSGMVSDFFGRKKALWLNCIVGIIGGSLNIIVWFSNSKVNLFIARLILGLNAGITTGIAPTFIAEISPTSLRGALTACHQLFITLGIVVAYFFTMKFTLNNDYWVFSAALPVIPAVISFCLLPFLPESPRYLFINKDDIENAKIAFEKYNQIQDPETQLNEIKKEVEEQKALPKFRIIDLFTSKHYRLAVIISIVLNVMQQFSGINAVIGYSQNMMLSAKVPLNYLEICVLLIGIFNCVSTIPAVILMEITGRRKLLIYPSFLLIASLLICFIMVGIIPPIFKTHTNVWATISVVAIFLYIIGFAIGLGPIPGIVVAEIFTQAPRAAAYSLALGIQWFSSFIILLLYPIINDVIPSGYVFVIFLCFTVPSLTFLVIFMPETKNRSFAEIAKILAGNKVENSEA
uniref:Slc2a-6 n=1 Tax=Schmidtea mediterranea TaxID=79327 RepID=A0A0H3YEU7_SCHMD|nr:slc2a-6 [Schmidtea mediterranea]